jgi:hypothetical protein
MISITISPEQLAAAPPDVRRWLESEVASTLAFVERQHGPAKAPAAELAACSPEEVAQIFELVRHDYLAASLLCELGREQDVGHSTPPYRAISIADLVRRSRLGSGDRLMVRLEAINAALHRIRGDAAASMFGFDQFGRLYIHEVTQRHIAELWNRLLAADAAAPAQQVVPAGGRAANDPAENRAAPGERGALLDEMLGTPL